jgi:uncharacterized protein (TIRG00374 family)
VKRGISMKRQWFLWALLIIFLWAVITHLTEIENMIKTLTEGKWQYILAAGILQAFYYILFTLLYHAAFHTAGVKSRIRELFPVMLASLFVNMAPTGGMSGAALFVYDAARRGESAARATAGTVLVQVADYTAFTPILGLGLLYLFQQHDLKIYEINATILLLLVITGLSSVLLMGLWQPERLRHFLDWLQRTINKGASYLKRPPVLLNNWAEKNTIDFAEAATAMVKYPRRLSYTIAVALASHIINLSSLFLVVLAFHQSIGLGILVAGYAMAFLFAGVALIPQGIGVVEGGMALVYTSLGLPVETATVIALAFRGLSFWLPMGVGFFLLRQLNRDVKS